jgi:hypothetical protein
MADGDLVSDFSIDCPKDREDFDVDMYSAKLEEFFNELKSSMGGDLSPDGEEILGEPEEAELENPEEESKVPEAEGEVEIEVTKDDGSETEFDIKNTSTSAEVEVEIDGDSIDIEIEDDDEENEGETIDGIIRRLNDDASVTIALSDKNELYVSDLEKTEAIIKFKLGNTIYKVSVSNGEKPVFNVDIDGITYPVAFDIIDNPDSEVAATIDKGILNTADTE